MQVFVVTDAEGSCLGVFTRLEDAKRVRPDKTWTHVPALGEWQTGNRTDATYIFLETVQDVFYG